MKVRGFSERFELYPCIWGDAGVSRERLSNSYGSDGIHLPNLGSKKCNLVIQILAINEVDPKYLAPRNATYCVLFYFPNKSDVKDPVTRITP